MRNAFGMSMRRVRVDEHLLTRRGVVHDVGKLWPQGF